MLDLSNSLNYELLIAIDQLDEDTRFRDETTNAYYADAVLLDRGKIWGIKEAISWVKFCTPDPEEYT